MKIKHFAILVALMTLFFTLLASCSKQGSGTDANHTGSYQRAGLMGQVSTIAGNDLTLKVISMPSFSENSGYYDSNRSRSRRFSNSGFSFGSRTGSWGGFHTGSYSSGSRSGFSGRSLQFTGEEKDVIIPVGVPVVKTERGQNGVSQESISFSSIQEGDIVSIYYASDGKTIVKVSVSGSYGQTGTAYGGRNNGDSN